MKSKMRKSSSGGRIPRDPSAADGSMFTAGPAAEIVSLSWCIRRRSRLRWDRDRSRHRHFLILLRLIVLPHRKSSCTLTKVIIASARRGRLSGRCHEFQGSQYSGRLSSGPQLIREVRSPRCQLNDMSRRDLRLAEIVAKSVVNETRLGVNT